MTSDAGWILQKCAEEISRNSPNITHSLAPDPGADIQYYLTYSARKARVSKLEGAFFTHLESEENAKKKFFDTAAQVDFCVAMSTKYYDILKGRTTAELALIKPGVDLDRFKPKITLGVVGRTYNTGRKGEELVKHLLHIQGTQWKFTGAGWPGNPEELPDEKMPDFYNSLDYLVVPSLYEGGPMSVIEALACGVPVIAPDVGWVRDYPHIPFKAGDHESLKSVINRLVYEKRQYRSSVKNQTWQSWSCRHHELFQRVIQGIEAFKNPLPALQVLTHGDEHIFKGGPSIRAPRMITALRDIGHSVCSDHNSIFTSGEHSQTVTHILNIWPPESCLSTLKKNLGKTRIVLSPIFLNLSSHSAYNKLPKLLSDCVDAGAMLEKVSTLQFMRQGRELLYNEPYHGYHDQVRSIINLADGLILLSKHEKECLESIGCQIKDHTIIHNAVPLSQITQRANPRINGETQHSKIQEKGYILCIGRIEPRKNQLILALAAYMLKKPLVLIGEALSVDQDYLKLVLHAGGEYVKYLGRVQNQSPLFLDALRGADVFCQPSWAEGASLAALEAAAYGVPLVLSNQSAEKEYFGEHASYIHPIDVRGMAEAIMRMSEKRNNTAYQEGLSSFVREKYSWDSYIEKHSNYYRALVRQDAKQPLEIGASIAFRKFDSIVYDITDFVYAVNNPTGIPRVVEQGFCAINKISGTPIFYVCWKKQTSDFVFIPPGLLEAPASSLCMAIIRYVEGLSSHCDQFLPQTGYGNSLFVTLGGAWTGHRSYAEAVIRLKAKYSLRVAFMVHDLIRWEFSYLYPKTQSQQFADHAKTLFPFVDTFLVYSESTKLSLLKFFHQTRTNFFPEIIKCRLGDMTNWKNPTIARGVNQNILDRLNGQRFVLYVSTLDPRKNHVTLLRVWEMVLSKYAGSNRTLLVLVGRKQPSTHFIFEMIERSVILKDCVIHLENLSDATLQWLYRNCLFTVFPSIAEGWGLPVAESLSLGKHCITCSGTSTEEIAPELTDLLDPYDVSSWVKMIGFYLDNEEDLARRNDLAARTYQPYRWDDAIDSILDHAKVVDGLRAEAPCLSLGETILLGKQHISDPEKYGSVILLSAHGWAVPDANGIWQLDKTAYIFLNIVLASSDRVSDAYELVIVISSLEGIKSICISHEEGSPKSYAVSRKPKEIRYPFVSNDIKDLDPMQLRIQTDILVKASDHDAGKLNNDPRILGVKIHSISLARQVSPASSRPIGGQPNPDVELMYKNLNLKILSALFQKYVKRRPTSSEIKLLIDDFSVHGSLKKSRYLVLLSQENYSPACGNAGPD